MKINRIDCFQPLLSSQANNAMTNFTNHGAGFSHDCMNSLLLKENLTRRIVWDHGKGDIVHSPNGCLIFDDSASDENHSHRIELAQKQYSGNAHGLIKGIGIVNCLHVNPNNGKYWIVDYRIFNPGDDGKTRLEHVHEMPKAAVGNKSLTCSRMPCDGWHGSEKLMPFTGSTGKFYCCSLENTRLADDSGGEHVYRGGWMSFTGVIMGAYAARL